jgi:hypothetical protein
VIDIKQQLRRFYADNRKAIWFLIIGLICSITASFLFDENEWVYPWYLTLIRLVGLISLSISLFLVGAGNKRYLFANIGLILVLVMSFELICFLMLGLPNKENKDFTIPEMPPEHISSFLGTVPYSDSVYHEVKVVGSDTVFDVNYTITPEHMRLTPSHDSTKTKHALFFGCSIAYGYGLNDNNTFPYYFQEGSEYNSYNLAFTGYGTNQMLARFEYEDISEHVVEEDGIAVYVFFWDHIERAIGSMDRYVKWVSNAPYYEYQDDKLVRNRSFKEGRSFVSGLYERLYQSSIVQYFEVGFPLGLNETHFDLVSEMILESKKKYKEQFGSDKFYVAVYPSFTEVDQEKYEKFLSSLTDKKIDYIDLTTDFEYKPEHTLGGDPHPNANTNKVLSERLLKEIEKK